jgi:hypothetical protein
MLTTAPPTTLKKNLEGCNTIADNIKMANVILICPVPRYVLEKCCNDPAHIENHSNMDFDEEITEYQEQNRRVLVGWATTRGLDFSVMDPTAIVNPTEPLLRNRTTSGGTSIWCLAIPCTCRGARTRIWRWRFRRPMKARTWRESLPLSAAALATQCQALDPGHAAPPMALKKGGLRMPLSPCQSRKRQNEDGIHVPLLRLVGYAECQQGCTEPVQTPFLGSEVPTEVGLGAPVVTVASVASMGIGPKRGGLPLAADGRLICLILAGDCVF